MIVAFTLWIHDVGIPKYDALRDENLRQYFESKQVQQYLYNQGWIDRDGRIIDIDSHKSKLAIIEQEFKYAEKAEMARLKEEGEMRRTIQIKRQRALEEARRAQRMAKIQEERRIRIALLEAMKEAKTAGMGGAKKGSKGKAGGSSARAQVGGRSSVRRDSVDSESHYMGGGDALDAVTTSALEQAGDVAGQMESGAQQNSFFLTAGEGEEGGQ